MIIPGKLLADLIIVTISCIGRLNMKANDDLICVHEVDRSLLKSGLTFSIAQRDELKAWLGELKRGQERTVTIMLNGKPFYATLRNVGLDPVKFADETDRYQLRYDGMPIVEELVRTFSVSRAYIDAELARRAGDPSVSAKAHIAMPPDQREEVAFHRTALPYVWQAVPHLAAIAVGSLLERMQRLEDRLALLEGRLALAQ